MPAINCGTDENPKWYLPENLRILPYQLYKRKVPEHLTSGMLGFSCHPPYTSRALIEHEGLAQLNLTPGAGLAAFVSIEPLDLEETDNASLPVLLFGSIPGCFKSQQQPCPIRNRCTAEQP
jgi:hypothetical protein